MKISHISLLILTLSVIFWCCTSKIDNAVDEPNNLSKCRIIPDSINIKIQFGQTQIVKTDKGDMEITLRLVDDFCPQIECKSCDVLAGVFFDIKLRKETMQLNQLFVERCGGIKPPKIRKFTNDFLCSYPVSVGSGTIGITHNGNLIFAIVELYPYPNTWDEMKTLTKEKKYMVNLLIKNRCQP